VLNNRASNQERQFPALHQGDQQKSVFTADCGGIKEPAVDIDLLAADGEPGCIQVPDTAVRQ